MNQNKEGIARSYQKWLALLVATAFLAATVFLWITQTRLSESNAINLMELNLADVRQDISDASDEKLLDTTRRIAEEVSSISDINNGFLHSLALRFNVSEINLIDENGIIIATTHDAFMDYDMASGAQSGEFLVLLQGEREYVQSYQPTAHDPSLSRKYSGVTLNRGGFIQVGNDYNNFRRNLGTVINGVTRNRHVGENGCIIIADSNYNIVSDPRGGEGRTLQEVGLPFDFSAIPSDTCFTAVVHGAESYCLYLNVEGYYAVAVLPTQEAVLSRNVSVGTTLLVELVVFIALFIMVFFLTKRLIVNNLQKINGSLSEITSGNLDAVVDVRSHREFSTLSDDINATVDTLKRYIADAAARIDAELEFARTIQYSSLPSVFPNREEFDIWAGMYTAKEVGGDFYDFYMINEETLAFLVADVSGKGIPAAMFMMSAKSVLKSLAESGTPIEQVFMQGNEILCAGNDTGMFLTAWMGVLNTKTGDLRFVNAGHNPPLLRQANGEFIYLKARSGIPLASMEGMRYRPHQLQLAPGDEIFLYTDGVTEGNDLQGEFYGEARLLSVLNANIGANAQTVCTKVKADLDTFCGEAEQFDDITLLAVKFHGLPKPDELTLDATVANIDTVTEFITQRLEQIDCPMKAQMQLCVAIDEIFGNIANYAYPNGGGRVTVQYLPLKDNAGVTITFIDSGIPFDPLAQKDPDITLSAEERTIGGLGIHLVKRL